MRSLATADVLTHLMNCVAASETCADRCLDEKEIRKMTTCIRTDLDCADMCTLTARYLARNSPHLSGVLEQCIAICQACEAECRRHDMDHCRTCADACAACKAACMTYLAQLGVPGFHHTVEPGDGRVMARMELDATAGDRADTGTGDQPGNIGSSRFSTPNRPSKQRR
ncbi:MAG TPA: four-helix bundle copper-binding protein [Flavobacteriales bacterium]|nr:four-helix bundle copper-binding protein [Flavobacteriales bacterium]HNU57323.1 four-helix bundle copper-binding protein [Flavobacteriales bacterium]